MQRKPDKVFTSGPPIVVCNDGSIWQYYGLSWQRLPDIPQEKAEGTIPHLGLCSEIFLDDPGFADTAL